MTVGIFGTVLVVLAVLVIVLVSVTGSKTPAGATPYGTRPAPATVVSAISSVPPSSFTAAGSTIGASGPYVGAISALSGQPRLNQDGKPLIVYVGSEWCPYCAATRWPLAVALERFGSFTGLHMTSSSLTDVDSGTPSLSFYGATYSSKYVAFSGTEQCTDIPSTSTSTAVLSCNGYLPLKTPPATITKLFSKYDYPPYVPTSGNSPGGIPFVDFANRFHEDGAFMDPAILSGYTHQQVADSLSNPVVDPGKTILVSANFYSAMICQLTSNQPGSVCQMPVVKQAAAQLKQLKL